MYVRKPRVRKGVKPVRKAAKRTYKPRATFAKKVQQVMSRNVENKTIQQSFTNALIKNYHCSGWASDCFGIPMSPMAGNLQIGQGVGQGQRIGNSINKRAC